MRGLPRKDIICIRCPKGCRINVDYDEFTGEIGNIIGYGCEKGKEYAENEFKNPTRIVPTTVKVKDGELPLVSVKTEKGIPKSIILSVMDEISDLEVEAPVKIGQILKRNLRGTGVNLVATRNIRRRDGNI